MPDHTHLLAAGIAIFVLGAMWVLVRRTRKVQQPDGAFVLPHVDMARPRRRLARGSVAFPTIAEVDVAELASRRMLRPSHARRTA